MLIDTHAHIYKQYYENIEHALTDIDMVINCATKIEDFEEIIKLSRDYNSLYFTLGIHPEEVLNFKDNSMTILEDYIIKNLHNKKFLGIGEIGLDYHFDSASKLSQKELLIFQLELAKKYNLPIIIHSREATKEILEILNNYNLKGIIHCFSGSLETAKEYLKLGYKLGIGGVITFKNCNLKNYIKKIGIENIVLETDSPYMSPDPLRGKMNYPKNVKIVSNLLSKIFNLKEEEIEKITCKTVQYIFDITIDK